MKLSRNRQLGLKQGHRGLYDHSCRHPDWTLTIHRSEDDIRKRRENTRQI